MVDIIIIGNTNVQENEHKYIHTYTYEQWAHICETRLVAHIKLVWVIIEKKLSMNKKTKKNILCIWNIKSE